MIAPVRSERGHYAALFVHGESSVARRILARRLASPDGDRVSDWWWIAMVCRGLGWKLDGTTASKLEAAP